MIGIGRPSAASNAKASTRHPRQSSSAAFNVFDAQQIQTFREAFSLIDQNNDGVISESDLKAMLTGLGQTPSPGLVSSLLSAKPNADTRDKLDTTAAHQITFPIFLTMMAEHLSELDTELDLLEAFACFDEGDKGFIDGSEMKEYLESFGDRMSKAEIDSFLIGPFTDRKTGSFNYRAFCQTLRVTDVDEELARANEKALQ